MSLEGEGLSDAQNNQLRKVIELRDYREMLRIRAEELPDPAYGTQLPPEGEVSAQQIISDIIADELARIRTATEGTQNNTDPDNPANCAVTPAINTTYFQTEQRLAPAVF